LEKYRLALAQLTAGGRELELRKILTCLLTRDAVERNLREVLSRGGAEAAEELVSLDVQLRALAPRLSDSAAAIADWRRSLKPPGEAWWWSPHAVLSSRVAKIETAMELLTLTLLPVSLALAIDLAGRFGSEGGSLWGALAIILPTALGSLRIVASGFRERMAAFLTEAGLEVRRWRPAFSAVILVGLLVICLLWFARPAVSRYFNDRGVAHLADAEQPLADLAVARVHLERAVRFDPANPVAHYNLATVYEDLLEEEKALAEYQIAAAAGLDLACNNLGRLYVRRGEYGRAAALLRQAVEDMRAENSVDQHLRYNVLKNLAWARIGQGRLGEARSLLEEAAGLMPNLAPAHCLLARALAETGDAAGAVGQWRRCLAWADPRDPDEDAWIGEARAALRHAARREEP
jgi:Flp pilus assembly protein TadD